MAVLRREEGRKGGYITEGGGERGREGGYIENLFLREKIWLYRKCYPLKELNWLYSEFSLEGWLYINFSLVGRIVML